MDLEALLPARDRSPADYVRVAEDPGTSAQVLAELAACPYPFVHLAVARHPNADLAALGRLLDAGEHSVDGFNRLLYLLATHRLADRELLLGVVREAGRLLGGTVVRPYIAVYALAGRVELAADEVRALTVLPGASRRFRRRVREILDGR